MPGHHIDFGHYGATGQRSSLAAAEVLDGLAGGITSPVTTHRGLAARLRYMTRSKHAQRTMANEGLNPAPATLRKWLDGSQTPREDNLTLIEETYRRMRRHNVARYLLQRLNANGGTLIEIHPAEDGNVAQEHRRRDKSVRKVKIRSWDAIVAGWSDGGWEKGSERLLDDAWIDELRDAIGSDWGAYEYTRSLGFAA
ncbi:transcriptional regulator (plasmid) [Streptomyces sp. NBC_01298]|uniref:transcriptional regulator n=1 Tax=Streptomyces sp. NBC_01298 TaxID=2903817 RepID=UPI002E135DBA|nr:transcriptional regulator [Streptomyces sp. NBC_01298]